MTTLSEGQENTSAIAKKTINLPVGQPCSLIKSGGKTITAQLLTQTPQENTSNLVQFLKHTLKLPVNISKRTVFTQNGCDFIEDIEVGEMTEPEKEQARQAVDLYLAPLPITEIIKFITRLQIIAPEKEKTTIDIEARTSIWLEELRKYPADIVIMALKKKYRWFPSLAEVMDYCDNEVARRKLIKLKLL